MKKIDRQYGLAGALSAFSLLLLGACNKAADVPAAIEHPNVLLISLDTLRADFLGSFGYARDSSPAIDSVASAGTRFLDVTSAAPWTLPSHASLLSGLYPSHHGVTDKEFRLTGPTLPKLFRAAGYRTMAINNALLVGHPSFNLMQGFDLEKYEPEQSPGRPTLNSAGPIVDQAISWLGAETDSKPFFMFLHFYDAHTDFTPDAKWRKEFVGPYAGKLTGMTMQLIASRQPGNAINAEDTRFLRDMYAAEIRTLDSQLERLFVFLDDAQLTQSTVVVITSDHGEEFMEHGGVLHGRTHFQELLHIPLILRGPGIPVGQSFETPVHLVDVAPTLLHMAGIEAPPVDGLDLSRQWTAPGDWPMGRYLFAEADHNNVAGNNLHRMVRQGSIKLHYDTLTKRKTMFDLAQDPGEQHDILDQEPELAARLWKELQRFMDGTSNGIPTDALSEAENDALDALGYAENHDD